MESGGIVIDERRLPGRQGRLVFAMLAAEHRHPLSRDELGEQLWGERPPPAWEVALSAIVSKLRGLLREAGLPPGTITTAFGCYRLDLPGHAWIDLEAAVDALHEAEVLLQRGDARGAYGPAHIAGYIAGRPFLPGEDGPWATRRREDLGRVLLRATDALAQVCAAVGEPVLATQYAERAVQLEPLREAGWRQLMRRYVEDGSPAQAIRTFERCRKTLAEELGVSPGRETEDLYLEILRSS